MCLNCRGEIRGAYQVHPKQASEISQERIVRVPWVHLNYTFVVGGTKTSFNLEFSKWQYRSYNVKESQKRLSQHPSTRNKHKHYSYTYRHSLKSAAELSCCPWTSKYAFRCLYFKNCLWNQYDPVTLPLNAYLFGVAFAHMKAWAHIFNPKCAFQGTLWSLYPHYKDVLHKHSYRNLPLMS